MSNYTQIFGTGGIGSGVIYALEGNHSLGRGETRLGTKLPNRDFCKLHIICHYLSVILKEYDKDISIFPIGAIGDDNEGRNLIKLFDLYGISTKHVKILENIPTLNSICFQYPDGSGGNITESRSASSEVDVSFLNGIDCQLLDKRTIVFAVPEVPVDTRIRFLNLPWKEGTWKAASFLSSEIKNAYKLGVFKSLSLLALNMNEAMALINDNSYKGREKKIDLCAELVLTENPELDLIITDGADGAYVFSANMKHFVKAINHEVRNSAGAGDAFFAGLIIGRVMGLIFSGQPGISSIELANSLAALSVESADTINFDINFNTLKRILLKEYKKNFIEADQ